MVQLKITGSKVRCFFGYKWRCLGWCFSVGPFDDESCCHQWLKENGFRPKPGWEGVVWFRGKSFFNTYDRNYSLPAVDEVRASIGCFRKPGETRISDTAEFPIATLIQ